MKKIYWLLPTALVGLFALKRAGILDRTDDCQTAPEAADPALRTRVYAATPEAVRDAVKTALARQSTRGRGWNTVAEREDGALAIRVEIPVLAFTHDLTVTVSPHERGARLDIHSRSRVGRGDFGESKRHVLQLLAALDAVLQKAPGAPLPDRRAASRATESGSPAPAGEPPI